ncbi:MAG: HRDC domain-containing protein [Myxococcota bacterium]
MEWIEQEARCEAFFSQLSEGTSLAVDTESNTFHHYNHRICVVQIKVDGEVFAFDALALEDVLSELLPKVLETHSIRKILHSAHNDLLAFQRDYGSNLANLFDTQLAATFLQLPYRSLSKILEDFFQVKTNKRFQRFDWMRRPLPQEALHYAANDVLYLHELARRFEKELEASGWLEAYVQEVDMLLQQTGYVAPVFSADHCLKIKGAKMLSLEEQRVLRALFVWRHETCVVKDVAAFKLVSDAQLLKLAQRQPRSRKHLIDCSLKPSMVRRYGEGILEAIDAGLRDCRPFAKPEYGPRQPSISSELYDHLRIWRTEAAQREGFESGFLLPNEQLKAILRLRPHSIEEFHQIPTLTAWRIERYGEEILAQLW